MYQLILTKEERKAIDWIGDRYSHGNDLYDCLCQAEWSRLVYSPECEWDGDYAIGFDIPEHVAWEICDIIDEGLDCFGSEFCAKLHDFAGKVVRDD